MIALIVSTWLSTAPGGGAGVVVLDVDAAVLDDDTRRALQARVASGVAAGTDDDVATTADLRALADVAAAQQALDCDGSSSCLAELADAYGAQSVVSTRVSKVAGQYAIEVVLLDAHSARVLKRVDGAGSKKELLGLAKTLGRAVVAVDDDDEDDGASGLFVGGVVTGVVGVVALGVGGVGAVVAQGAVSGRGVSAADKNLGFNTRLPLLGVAAVGAVVTVVGVALAVVGAE